MVREGDSHRGGLRGGRKGLVGHEPRGGQPHSRGGEGEGLGSWGKRGKTCHHLGGVQVAGNTRGRRRRITGIGGGEEGLHHDEIHVRLAAQLKVRVENAEARNVGGRREDSLDSSLVGEAHCNEPLDLGDALLFYNERLHLVELLLLLLFELELELLCLLLGLVLLQLRLALQPGLFLELLGGFLLGEAATSVENCVKIRVDGLELYK